MNKELLAICLMIVLLGFYCLYGQICYKKHNKIVPINNMNINNGRNNVNIFNNNNSNPVNPALNCLDSILNNPVISQLINLNQGGMNPER